MLLVRRMAAVGLALSLVGLTGTAACGGNGKTPPMAQTPETAGDAESSGLDLAGEIGPNGGVINHGREMESTPESLYPYQTDGATAVGPIAAFPGGLSVLRQGHRLCIELHGLPIGGPREIARSCEIPAYRLPEEVGTLGRAYVSDVDIEGKAMRVAWGMTYLDAASVDFGAGTTSTTPETHMPFWMHRFFALPAPPEATALRLVDESGKQLAEFPLEIPA